MGWVYSRVTSVQAGEKDATVFLNAAITHYKEGKYGTAMEFAQAAARMTDDKEIMTVAHVYEVILCRQIGRAGQADELLKLYDNYYFRQYVGENPDIQQLINENQAMSVSVAVKNVVAGQSTGLKRWLNDNDFISVNDVVWGNTPLHVAVEQEYLAICAELLKNNANINAKNKDGNTPLHMSISNGSMKISELLIKNGADLGIENNAGVTPLQAVITPKAEECLLSLVQAIPNLLSVRIDGGNLLHLAIKNNLLNLFKYLLQNGFSVDTKDEAGNTLLHLAALYGSYDICKFLVKHGVNLTAKNKAGETVWNCAQKCSDNEGRLVVENFLLVECKSWHLLTKDEKLNYVLETDNANLLEKMLQTDKNTPSEDTKLLHEAVKNDAAKVCKLLLDSGVDVESGDVTGYPPLYRAAEHNSINVAKVLLDYGAKVSSKSVYLSTPLHIAAKKNNADMCKLLLAHGAEVITNNVNNSNVLSLARMSHADEAAKILEKALMKE